MCSLSKKIDFILFFSVKNANPNGDPLMGNLPRTDYEGYGEVSDVAIKRKIRNRFQDLGYDIFVQADDRITDGYTSLKKRYDETFKVKEDTKTIQAIACQKWMDVRAFGQVLAFKSNDKDEQGISIAVRGPVSCSIAKSLDLVNVRTMQITRSTNGQEGKKEGDKVSDRMGSKHFVEYGVYKVCGSINCYFAEKTGFTDEDAEIVKEALQTLFENDMSSARPEGSMAVERLYWFTHPNKLGCTSTAHIHNLVEVKHLVEGAPRSFADYEITLNEDKLASYKADGLTVEIIE